MKKVSRVLSVLLVVMLIVTAPVSVFAASKGKHRVNLRASNMRVYVGSSKKLSVKATKGSKIYYRAMSNTVYVSGKGIVKGKKAGTGKVKVVAKKKGYKSATRYVIVKVVKRNQKVSAKNLNLKVGESASIGAKAKTGLKFKSSNSSVVSVSSNGIVKAKKGGAAKITVYTQGNSKYNQAYKVVTVKVAKRNQKVSAKNVIVNVGESASLDASAKTGLKFKSSNTEVATVSSNGVVVGKNVGTAKITVYTNGNGTYNKASCTVTVNVTKPAHKHSYKKVVIPAKTHTVEHKEEGHWVEPKWVVDKPASKVVDVPEHDAYVCSVCGAEFNTQEEADAHVASENSKHTLASKVNKVVHHDAVAEVSHQELVTPAQGWIICDGPNGTGCSEHFETPDDNAIEEHQSKYVIKNTEIAEKYFKEGYSQLDALAKANEECPLHDITHVEHRPAVYKTVIDTPAQEAWDETLPDVYVFTCSCGVTFESEDEFSAHVVENSKASVESKHVDATYKDVPEEGHYEGERTWVVDKKAYTETVVDSPEKVIYKCSCGAIKK